MSIDNIIENILTEEGGYTNDDHDAGGETMYGITITTAKANGYFGAMKDLPKSLAKQIYLNKYYLEPHFDQVATISESVAAELTDCGVNCGVNFAETILQQCLNLLNRSEKDYKDISEDGKIGAGTISALASYSMKRGKEGEAVLLKLLGIHKGFHYVQITKTRPANEDFLYGWIKNRVHF